MTAYPADWFASDCQDCPRLAGFLHDVREKHPDYHAAPVPPVGPADARLLVVGLAPGMHGANRTGRPFTGDYAGVLLYQTLFDLKLSDSPVSTEISDPITLTDCRISNAVKCLPPQNKPETAEINVCNRYLAAELASTTAPQVIVSLGLIAHKAVLKALDLKQSKYPFGHAARHALPDGRTLFDSYHCSRYNTQTRRLTPEMFRDVFEQACAALND